MQFGVLQVLAGMFLMAIGRVCRFAQVWNVLVNIAFYWLVQVVNPVQQVQICYNLYASRKCTLKIKYDMLHKRGRFKASETLLGIETNSPILSVLTLGFKASETLLGIETSFVYQVNFCI
ncbi:MAG: hypothetical protein ACK5C4_01595 [Pseudanabaena sp.]